MQSKLRNLVIAVLLGLTSLPLVVMLISLLLDTVTTTRPGSLVPDRFTLDAWQFLWSAPPGRPSIWITTFNTIVFAGCSTPAAARRVLDGGLRARPAERALPQVLPCGRARACTHSRP